MTRIRLMLNVFVVSVVCVLFSSMAHAQATRTWVSGVGDDANPCSRTAPCKTFAGAISKTAAGGEISVLDPGGFGQVTITKAITISGDGTLAGVLVSAGTSGIIVNATNTPNDVVIIRSISINGIGSGLNGIRYLAGKHLHVENCTINGFTAAGIDAAQTTTPGVLSVVNTSITNCATGVHVAAASGGFNNVTINSSHIQRCNDGVGLDGGFATISDSSITQNTNNGIAAKANNSFANAVNCILSNNLGNGIAASVSGATIRISGCQILSNSTGVLVAAGATGIRYGNNVIDGNSAAQINGTLQFTVGQQ